MFKPSTAPRWKIATRIFLRPPIELVAEPAVSAAKTERDNHAGMAPTPNIASAEPFRKTRLDGIYLLPLLEIRRPNYQRGHQRRVLLLIIFQGFVDGRARFGRHGAEHQSLGDLARVVTEARHIYLHALHVVLRQLQREVH